MSKIKNGGLDQYVGEPFEQQQFGLAGVEGVKEICCNGMQMQGICMVVDCETFEACVVGPRSHQQELAMTEGDAMHILVSINAPKTVISDVDDWIKTGSCTQQ